MKTISHLFSFKAALPAILATGIVAATLNAAPPAAPPGVDPATHAAHVAAGTHPAAPAPAAPAAAKGDPALSQQLSQLQAKNAQLEAAMAKNVPAGAATPPADPKAGAGIPPAGPMAGMASPGTGAAAAPAPAMEGMDGPSAMMGMMEKMMGMMDKMMSMEGGGMAPAAPGGKGMGMEKMKMGGGSMPADGMKMPKMGMDKMKMGGGSMPAGGMKMPEMGMDKMKMGGGSMPAGGMKMPKMGMDKMKMAGMMGMGPMGSGAGAAMPQSALPGFPGSSHLYHLGATDFFLDHQTHIALTTEQTAALNKAKEQALLAKSTADRASTQAEQELWTLTASDRPDAAKIETKISEIGKLTGDERLAFIRVVGEASKLLTDEQRKILTGFAPPAPAAPAAAMAPMKGM